MTNNPLEAIGSDVIIFEKVHGLKFNQIALEMKKMGSSIVYDACDPEWIGQNPIANFAKEMILNIADLVTVPTQKMSQEIMTIAHEIGSKVPVEIVEDCLDEEYHSRWKMFHDPVKTPVVVWFGNGTIDALQFYIPTLEWIFNQIPFELRIIDNGRTRVETKIPTSYRKWELETFVDEMVQCDIAFNPKKPTIVDSMKSSNKTISAWACGLPCVEVWGHTKTEDWTVSMKELLVNHEMRQSQGRAGREYFLGQRTSKHYAEKLTRILTEYFGDRYSSNNRVG